MLNFRQNIEVRCDDVFLLNNLTGSMKNCLRHGSFFEHFKKFDLILKDNNLHCVLSLIAEGIPFYPEWVDYIKTRRYRYTLALHGFSHYHYERMSEEEGYRSLKLAKWMIEKEFGEIDQRWYVPFGRFKFPEWSYRVCDRLGIDFNTRNIDKQFFFHYWNSRDRLRLERLIKEHGVKLKKAN